MLRRHRPAPATGTVDPPWAATDITTLCRHHEGDLLCIVIGVMGMRAVDAVFGAATGELVMAQVHTKLRSVSDVRTIVERTSNGHFVIVTSSTTDDRSTVNRLLWAAREPLTSPLGDVVVGCAAGITIGCAQSADDLLERAEQNLTAAIRRGAGAVEWNDERGHHATESSLQAGAPRDRSVGSDAGTVRFEPVVSLANGEVVEYEAMGRRRITDVRTLSGPRRLLRTRRDHEIAELDHHLVSNALAFMVRLRLQDPRTDVRVSLNMSARELSTLSFVSKITDELGRAEIPASCVQIELHDRFEHSQRAAINRTMTALHDRGVRFALDDFGREPGDLCALSYLEFDSIKLSCRLIAPDRDHRGDNLLSSVVHLAQRIGIDTVAKGVESFAQHDHVVRAGFTCGQGPLYGQPNPHPVTDVPSPRSAVGRVQLDG